MKISVFLLGLILQLTAQAAEYVPRGAYQYQRDLIQNVRVVWGLDAPIAVFAAQIHQESLWRPDAKSKFAAGLAQFTPGTANWISGIYRSELGHNQPYNPAWAMRALSRYDRHLWERLSAATDCDRWAFTLSAYNGGPGWVAKDRNLARLRGLNADQWFGSVEFVNAGRAEWAVKENKRYPHRILLILQPLYSSWGPVVICS